MAFTVEDLTDLIAILEQRPEWRERLREILLTKELLQLPQLVERIAKAVERLTEEAEENRQWRQRVDEWHQQAMEELKAMRQWQQQVVEWQREVTRWMEAMNRWRERMDEDLAYLKGSDRERYFRDRAHALFGRLVRRGRNPTPEVIERLWDAHNAGQISRLELRELADADLLWMGEYEGVNVLFVCEVSFRIGREDIERAIRRAEIARRLGYIAVPVVGGAHVLDEIADLAHAFNVIVMTDGEFNHERAEQILKRTIENAKPS